MGPGLGPLAAAAIQAGLPDVRFGGADAGISVKLAAAFADGSRILKKNGEFRSMSGAAQEEEAEARRAAKASAPVELRMSLHCATARGILAAIAERLAGFDARLAWHGTRAQRKQAYTVRGLPVSFPW